MASVSVVRWLERSISTTPPTVALVTATGTRRVSVPPPVPVLAACLTSLADDAALEDVSIKLPLVHETDGGLRHGLLDERDAGPAHAGAGDGGAGKDNVLDAAALSKDLSHMLLGDISREALYQD